VGAELSDAPDAESPVAVQAAESAAVPRAANGGLHHQRQVLIRRQDADWQEQAAVGFGVGFQGGGRHRQGGVQCFGQAGLIGGRQRRLREDGPQIAQLRKGALQERVPLGSG